MCGSDLLWNWYLYTYLILKRQPIDSQFGFQNVEFIWPKIILVWVGSYFSDHMLAKPAWKWKKLQFKTYFFHISMIFKKPPHSSFNSYYEITVKQKYIIRFILSWLTQFLQRTKSSDNQGACVPWNTHSTFTKKAFFCQDLVWW